MRSEVAERFLSAALMQYDVLSGGLVHSEDNYSSTAEWLRGIAQTLRAARLCGFGLIDDMAVILEQAAKEQTQ